MNGFVLIYVEMADYRNPSVHGPFETREQALDRLAEVFPGFEETETGSEDVFENSDDDVVIVAPLLGDA